MKVWAVQQSLVAPLFPRALASFNASQHKAPHVMTTEKYQRGIAFSRAWLEFLRNFATVTAYGVGAAVVARHPDWLWGIVPVTIFAALSLYMASLTAGTAASRLFLDALSARFGWSDSTPLRWAFDLFLIIFSSTVVVVAFNSVH